MCGEEDFKDVKVMEGNTVDQLATLHQANGRYALRFERFFSYKPEEVFRVITDPHSFSQWYPFATGEMDLKLGGEIAFDDGEGTTYEGIITELKEPYTFEFREVDDLIRISLQEEGKGCQLVFIHILTIRKWRCILPQDGIDVWVCLNRSSTDNQLNGKIIQLS